MQLLELTAENIQGYLDDCITVQKQLVGDKALIVPEHFVATAESKTSYFQAVVEDGHVIGMGVVSLVVHPVDITGFVNNIVVDENHRGKGVFSAIMVALEEKAKAWGCSDLALTCSRPEVQSLYEKRGYTEKVTKFYLKDI